MLRLLVVHYTRSLTASAAETLVAAPVPASLWNLRLECHRRIPQSDRQGWLAGALAELSGRGGRRRTWRAGKPGALGRRAGANGYLEP